MSKCKTCNGTGWASSPPIGNGKTAWDTCPCPDCGAKEEELKPCPFCGESPVIHEQETTFSITGKVFSIECNCGMSKGVGSTKERLLSKYNTRAGETK